MLTFSLVAVNEFERLGSLLTPHKPEGLPKPHRPRALPLSSPRVVIRDQGMAYQWLFNDQSTAQGVILLLAKGRY